MLKQITLTNFKRHEALSVSFSDGLTALKGGNEAGKSTLIQAITYALFGAKSLPYTLEDTVTRGKPVNSLKVTLSFTVAGVDYTISRGKSGAELSYGSETVTGQNETASFIGKLLGTDAQVAPKLILANQNEIRGALSAGAKAATDLIERLAEFDQLDKLIDLIQANLSTGSTAPVEAAVEAAQRQLQELPDTAPPPVESMAEAEAAADKVAKAAQEVCAALYTEHKQAFATYDAASESNRATQRLIDAVAREAGAVDAARARLQAAEKAVPKAPDEARTEELQKKLEAARSAMQLENVYNLVKPHLGLEPQYGGSLEVLDKELDTLRKWKESARLEVTKLNAEVRTLEALKVVGSCSLCGKDVSEVPEVLAKNKELDASIAANQAKAKALSARVAKALTDEQELLTIRGAAKGPLTVAERYADHLKVDASVLPPTLSWLGATDFGAVAADVAELESSLAGLSRGVMAYNKAKAEAEAAATDLKHAAAAHEAAKQKLGTQQLQDLTALKSQIESCDIKLASARKAADQAKDDLRNLVDEGKRALSAWEAHERLQSVLKEQAQMRQAELKALRFNNALLKAVRAARPVIADKLWALVLGAVSRYFSEMRGTRSIVTKGGDGFEVDGHSAATLSGSTLDILGLAVRVALVRTFVPNAPLLILDEPTAAMDEDRTATTLGFLAATGFKQTIIVSHESATESVADHLIEL